MTKTFGDKVPVIGPIADWLVTKLETKYGVKGGNSYRPDHSLVEEVTAWGAEKEFDAYIETFTKYANAAISASLKFVKKSINLYKTILKIEDFGDIYRMDDIVFQLLNMSGYKIYESTTIQVEYKMSRAYQFVSMFSDYFFNTPYSGAKSYHKIQQCIYNEKDSQIKNKLVTAYYNDYYTQITSPNTIIGTANMSEKKVIAESYRNDFLLNASDGIQQILEEFKSYINEVPGGDTVQMSEPYFGGANGTHGIPDAQVSPIYSYNRRTP